MDHNNYLENIEDMFGVGSKTPQSVDPTSSLMFDNDNDILILVDFGKDYVLSSTDTINSDDI